MAYQFDDRNISFRKVTTSFAKWLRRFLWWLLGSFTLSAAAYVLLSFFISTDREKELIKENRLYEQLYGQMLERQQLIQDVTDGLQARDHEIYDQIFHTKAPSLDPIESVDLALFSDTTSEESKVSITTRRLADLSAGAAMVEDNFREIFALLAERGVGNVPMQAPLPGVTYAQAGASVGQKTSPFYKIVTRHDGLDLMASGQRRRGGGVRAEVQDRAGERGHHRPRQRLRHPLCPSFGHTGPEGAACHPGHGDRPGRHIRKQSCASSAL